jgi:hypothetical protein
MVRGKFRVRAIEIIDSNHQNRETKVWEPVVLTTVKLSPVCFDPNNPDSENSTFWDASPSGDIQLGCINPDAAAEFVLGAEYYVDFTKAN